MSRTKRIEMMRKRFGWLSKLVKDCNTLEEFSCKYDEYLGIRGIGFKYIQGEQEATIDFSFCADEYYYPWYCRHSNKSNSVVAE